MREGQNKQTGKKSQKNKAQLKDTGTGKHAFEHSNPIKKMKKTNTQKISEVKKGTKTNNKNSKQSIMRKKKHL